MPKLTSSQFDLSRKTWWVLKIKVRVPPSLLMNNQVVSKPSPKKIWSLKPPSYFPKSLPPLVLVIMGCRSSVTGEKFITHRTRGDIKINLVVDLVRLQQMFMH